MSLSRPMSDTFEIWQLQHGNATRELRFLPLEKLEKYGLTLDLANYERMYCAPLKPDTTLEGLYTDFNIFRPEDFYGHSMSVSDIIVLKQNGESKPFYCDRIGFTDVSHLISQQSIQKERARQQEPEPPKPSIRGRLKSASSKKETSPEKQQEQKRRKTQVEL